MVEKWSGSGPAHFGYARPEQLQILTETLIDEKDLHSVVSRAGIYGDFSIEEQERLDRFVREVSDGKGFGFDVQPSTSPAGGLHPFDLNLAIVLARRILSGWFASPFDAGTAEFLNRNIYLRDRTTEPRRRAVHIREATAAAIDVQKDVRAVELFNMSDDLWAQRKQTFQLDREMCAPLLEAEERAKRKYGLNRCGHLGVFGVQKALYDGRITNVSIESVRTALEPFKKYSSIYEHDFISFEGPSNV